MVEVNGKGGREVACTHISLLSLSFLAQQVSLRKRRQVLTFLPTLLIPEKRKPLLLLLL